jgi:hypothetical protein
MLMLFWAFSTILPHTNCEKNIFSFAAFNQKAIVSSTYCEVLIKLKNFYIDHAALRKSCVGLFLARHPSSRLRVRHPGAVSSPKKLPPYTLAGFDLRAHTYICMIARVEKTTRPRRNARAGSKP